MQYNFKTLNHFHAITFGLKYIFRPLKFIKKIFLQQNNHKFSFEFKKIVLKIVPKSAYKHFKPKYNFRLYYFIMYLHYTFSFLSILHVYIFSGMGHLHFFPRLDIYFYYKLKGLNKNVSCRFYYLFIAI